MRALQHEGFRRELTQVRRVHRRLGESPLSAALQLGSQVVDHNHQDVHPSCLCDPPVHFVESLHVAWRMILRRSEAVGVRLCDRSECC